MTKLDRYLGAARSAGMPRGQVENYIRAGIVLNPGPQLGFAAAARECDVPGGPTDIGLGGARGGGKSFSVFCQLAIDDCQRVDGLKCLWLRKVGKGAKESLEDLRPQVLQGIQHKYNSSAGVIAFPNGSRIMVGNFKDERDIDKYLGLEYDVIAIEEDTTLSVTKKKAILTCLRTSKTNWRPRSYRTTNPGGVSHADFKKKFVIPFQRGQQTTTRFLPATFRDNPRLNPEYVQRLNDLVGWQKRAWRDGDWDVAAGMFFSNWSEASHVVNTFAIPEEWRVWLAMDYGFTHPTVVGLMAEDGDGNVYAVDEHTERKRLPEYHSSAMLAMLERNGVEPGRLYKLVAGADIFQQRGDSKARTIADQYRDLGWAFERADHDRINGAGEILQRLGDPVGDVPPSLFVFDRCHSIIEQVPAMVHDDNRPEDVDKVDADEDGNGGDDAYDMLRYGVMVAKRSAGGWGQNVDQLAKAFLTGDATPLAETA